MGLFGNKKKKETTISTVGTPTEQKAPIVTNGQTAQTPHQQVEKTVAQPVVKQPLPQQQVPGQVIQQTPVQQQVQTPAPVSVASPTPISIGANQTQVPVSNKTITNQPISASLQTPEQKSTTQDSSPQQHSTSKTVQTSSLSKKKVSSDEDVKRKNKLNGYSYVVINTMNKKEKGYFDAESEDDVRAFLEGQDYQVLEIKPKSAMDIDISGPPKLNPEELSFALTQLSTYIKSGIPLVDSMRILAKQGKKATHKKIYGQVVYELLKGESFSVALARQGKVFPPLLINMVKTAEMTGDLPSILDDMAEYYTSMNQTKKQMKSAMTYPVSYTHLRAHET